jgi:hypothetical protein
VMKAFTDGYIAAQDVFNRGAGQPGD